MILCYLGWGLLRLHRGKMGIHPVRCTRMVQIMEVGKRMSLVEIENLDGWVLEVVVQVTRLCKSSIGKRVSRVHTQIRIYTSDRYAGVALGKKQVMLYCCVPTAVTLYSEYQPLRKPQ